MRLRVSDSAATIALSRHLKEEGFPSTLVAHDELEVLYPGPPGDLVPAAELDLWRARHDGVTFTVEARPPR